MSMLQRIFDKIAAALFPWQSGGEHILGSKEYLTDPACTLTENPLLQFDVGNFIKRFNLLPIAENIDADRIMSMPDKNVKKHNGHPPLRLSVSISETGQVMIISLIGPNIQAHAVLKNPSGTECYHLDTISIFEDGIVHDIPCDRGEGDMKSLERIIACFHEATGKIYDDPGSLNEDNELWFLKNLKQVLADLAYIQSQRTFATFEPHATPA